MTFTSGSGFSWPSSGFCNLSIDPIPCTNLSYITSPVLIDLSFVLNPLPPFGGYILVGVLLVDEGGMSLPGNTILQANAWNGFLTPSLVLLVDGKLVINEHANISVSSALVPGQTYILIETSGGLQGTFQELDDGCISYSATVVRVVAGSPCSKQSTTISAALIAIIVVSCVIVVAALAAIIGSVYNK